MSATASENFSKIQQEVYRHGYDDGYKQAENDYFKKTEHDRQASYDCGYQQGKIDMLKEVYKHTQTDYYETLIDWVKDRIEYAEQLKEQNNE